MAMIRDACAHGGRRGRRHPRRAPGVVGRPRHLPPRRPYGRPRRTRRIPIRSAPASAGNGLAGARDPRGVTMSTAVLAPLATSRAAPTAARRPVVPSCGGPGGCSGREWRQQFLILALITIAVAATIVGSAVASNNPPPKNSGFGSAQDSVSVHDLRRTHGERHRQPGAPLRPGRADPERDAVDPGIDRHLSAPRARPARALQRADALARLGALPVGRRPGRGRRAASPRRSTCGWEPPGESAASNAGWWASSRTRRASSMSSRSSRPGRCRKPRVSQPCSTPPEFR